MTPRAIQPEVVLTRLREMQRLLDDLEKVGEVDVARLDDDRMLRHAVERIITALVDLAVSINGHLAIARGAAAPITYRASFAAAAAAGVVDAETAQRLERAAGMRNVLVHGYVDVEVAEVARAVPAARRDIGAYVRQVADWLSAYQDSL